jgi:hypothetical protein
MARSAWVRSSARTIFTEGEEPLGSPVGAANVGALVRDVAFVPNHQVPTGTSSPASEPRCAG